MADEIEAEVSSSTTGRRTGSSKRVQIIARMAPKRSWTVDEKIAILDEAFAPGGRVSAAAERHELNSGQLYTWRRLFLDGKLAASKPLAPAFAHVAIVPESTVMSPTIQTEPAPVITPAAHPIGKIEIELKSGVRIRVEDDVNGKTLKYVLDALRDR